MGWDLFGWKFIGTHLPALLMFIGAAVMGLVAPDTQFPAYMLLLILGGFGILAGQSDAALLRRLEKLEQTEAKDAVLAPGGRR
jgi:hypothetical protein